MRGFVKGERPSVLWFDLTITEFYKKWQGKLIIDWPPPARDWARFASAKNAKFSITAILEDSVFHEAMPPWNELVVSRPQFGVLPGKWHDELCRWRGIYYIFYPSDGKGYVGSAYGEHNINGRWAHHIKVGGDSVQLRKRKSENFEFSILELLTHDMIAAEVIDHENRWKKRLHTRSPFGLNDN
jgi:hypothetical protein